MSGRSGWSSEAMAEDPQLSLTAAVKRIGPRVGVVPDTLRGWIKQADIDAGRLPGPRQRRGRDQGHAEFASGSPYGLYRSRAVHWPPSEPSPRLLLGLGLGGFIDGIVLHQLLQWHHMVTGRADHPADTVAGLEANTFADGLFHVATWVLVAFGMTLMLRSWQQRRRAPTWGFQTGLLIAGWGVFNVVEGLVNHQILGLHHVRDDLGGPVSWDLGFLVFGLALIVCGLGTSYSWNQNAPAAFAWSNANTDQVGIRRGIRMTVA